MKKRFRTRFRRGMPIWIPITAIVACSFFLYQLYHIIVPFQSENPLWREVTIGQPVIDNWAFYGEDEEGYLTFSNGAETSKIAPTSHMFEADGQFVVLEHVSPQTITIAPPYDAAPIGWYLAGVVVVGGILVFGMHKFQRRNRMRLVKKPAWQGKTSGTRTTYGTRGAMKGFRPPLSERVKMRFRKR